MSTPAPELRKCPVCPISLNNLARETWLAKILCNAATDEFSFNGYSDVCLAMALFAEQRLEPPENAEELRDRMKELREPLS